MNEVEVWRDASTENKRLFDDTGLFVLDLKGVSYYKQSAIHEAEQSWEVFKKENNIRSIGEPASQSYSLLKYAASIVAIIAVGISVYLYQTRVEEITLAQTETGQELALPDGSSIALNESATIEYLEPFQNNERRVRLTGEAYFDVEKIQQMPFVVETGATEIRVLGTKFYILRPDDQALSVQVDEGKVLISHEDVHQIVNEGETVTLDLSQKSISATADPTGKSSFWKTRRLVFNETLMDEVVTTVNDVYGTSIQLEGSTEGCALTVTFENESIENVLEIISSTLNYEIETDQGSYILRSNGCQ